MSSERLMSVSRWLLVLVLVTPLVVIPWVLFPFVFAKALFAQVLILIVLAIAVAAGFRVRTIPRDPLSLSLYAFFAAALVSAVFGVDPRRSLLGSEERSAGVLFFAQAILFFVLARTLFRDERDWKRAGIAAVIFSGVLAGIAIVQVWIFNRTGIRIWGIDAGGRAAGFLGNPVYLGIFMPLAFSWMILGLREKGVMVKIISVAALVLALIADYLTRSRGAHLAIIVGIVAGGGTWLLGTKRRSIRRGAIAVGVCAVIAAAVLVIYRSHPAVGRLPVVGPILSSSLESGSVGTRALAWKTGLTAFLDRPLLGWGPDAFHLAFNAHYDPRFLEYSYYETWFDRAHNVPIDILVMMGAVGIGALVFVVVVVIAALRRLDRFSCSVIVGSLTAYAVAAFFAFDNPASTIYLMVLLAFLSWKAWPLQISNSKHQIPNKFQIPDSKPSRLKIAAVGLFVVVVIAVIDIIPATVSAKTREMAERFIVRDDPTGVRIFRELLDRWTIYPEEPRIDGAVTLTQAMTEPGYSQERFDVEFPQIERAVNDLIRIHPKHAYYGYLRGRVYSEASRFKKSYRDEAERSFVRAEELSPNRQQIAYGLGKLYLLHGEKDKAVIVMQEMVDLDPKVAQSHWYFGLALTEAGEVSRGEEEIVRAGELSYDPQTVSEALLLRELFLRRGNAFLTAEYADEVVRLEPTAARYAEAAAAYAAIGVDDKARKHVLRAVELDPSYTEEAQEFLSLLKSGSLRSASSTL